MELRSLLFGLLHYGVFPVWLAAGLGDYFAHRRTAIESTSGWRETWLHVVQMLEVAIPLLAILFLEITTLVLVIVFAGALLHTITFYIDIAYTTGRREITPAEQLVHCFLVAIPLFVAAILFVLYWPTDAGTWALQWKTEPLPAGYLLLILGCTLLLNLAPLLEEVWRTRRARGPGSADSAARA